MINTQTARMFARYKSWADGLLYGSVALLPVAEVSKTRQTLFKSIIGTLNHNYLVDLIWKANLLREPHGFTRRDVILQSELDSLRRAQQLENEWFEGWAMEQTESSLAEVIPFRYVSGQEFAMSRGAMLMHVVNHASYHRGWICQMFFEIPAKPPVTDLPVFLESCPDLDRPSNQSGNQANA
ncbi:DinB family protein [Paraburkholderia azotifigens]|uniref:DinB family protein n=1 Tax=Paraburkholderia azotifigens TaxID=2057004 RepID=UPI0031716867